MSDRYDAFISYSRADFDEVRTFVGRLASEVPGFRYWMDLEGIESGDQFIEKIVVAIDRSEHLLFMISDNSLKSPWTKKEVMYASNTGKRIVPVVLKGARLSGWYLFQFGNTDTIDTQDERQVQKLIKNLRDWCPTPGQSQHSGPERVEEDAVLFSFSENGLYGFRDKDGRTRIPCVYRGVKDFSEGLAAVLEDRKWGFVDKKGAVVIPLIYDLAWSFSEGLAKVSKDGKDGFVDKKGCVVIPIVYDTAYNFKEGRAPIRKDGKWGFIDKSGNVVVPLIYSDTEGFSGGLAKVSKDGKEGFVDKDGNVAVPLIYDFTGSFTNGLARVRKDGRMGFVDKNGTAVIPLIYDVVYDFSNGLAKVRKDGIYGYIDRNGNWVRDY